MLDWKLVQHPVSHVLPGVEALLYLGQGLLRIARWPTSSCWPRRARRSASCLTFLDLDQQLVPRIAALVRPQANSKWRTYADAAWFAGHERAAEDVLDKMLSPLAGTAPVCGCTRAAA